MGSYKILTVITLSLCALFSVSTAFAGHVDNVVKNSAAMELIQSLVPVTINFNPKHNPMDATNYVADDIVGEVEVSTSDASQNISTFAIQWDVSGTGNSLWNDLYPGDSIDVQGINNPNDIIKLQFQKLNAVQIDNGDFWFVNPAQGKMKSNIYFALDQTVKADVYSIKLNGAVFEP